MDVLYSRCCGLDVHKASVSACILIHGPGGKERHLCRFGTMTQDIAELAQWLAAHGVTNLAMESTGVYWKPIWNLLEDQFELTLVNAQHIKMVPGRKTDIKDCEWIAELLQHGLLKGSFVPPRAGARIARFESQWSDYYAATGRCFESDREGSRGCQHQTRFCCKPCLGPIGAEYAESDGGRSHRAREARGDGVSQAAQQNSGVASGSLRPF